MSSPSNLSSDLWEGFDALDAGAITGPVWEEPVPLKACRWRWCEPVNIYTAVALTTRG